jgi:hypothetical protein
MSDVFSRDATLWNVGGRGNNGARNEELRVLHEGGFIYALSYVQAVRAAQAKKPFQVSGARSQAKKEKAVPDSRLGERPGEAVFLSFS